MQQWLSMYRRSKAPGNVMFMKLDVSAGFSIHQHPEEIGSNTNEEDLLTGWKETGKISRLPSSMSFI